MITFTMKLRNGMTNMAFNTGKDFTDWIKECSVQMNTPVTEVIVNNAKVTPEIQLARLGTDEIWLEDILSYLRDLTTYQWRVSGIAKDYMDDNKYLANLILGTANTDYEDLFPDIHDTGMHSIILKFKKDAEGKPVVTGITYPVIKDNCIGKGEYRLTNTEKVFFEALIGDMAQEEPGESNDSQVEIIKFDKDLYDFGCMTANNIPALPLTIGYYSERRCKYIKERAEEKGCENFTFFPRIAIEQDVLDMVFAKYGEDGYVNHCLRQMVDVAAIPYLIANCDEITVTSNGIVCIRTKMDGKEYVFSLEPDEITMRSYVKDLSVEDLSR